MKLRAGISAVAFMAAIMLAPAAHADDAALRAQIQQLQAQMQQQAAQLQHMQQQLDEQATRPVTVANAPATPAPVAAPVSDSSTQIGSYAELNYNNYVNDDSRTQADLRRFVVTVAHQFNDRLSMNGEIEFEHAVTSSEDSGEAEIEQAWLAYRLTDAVNVKAGLFLMPFGLLNTNHEPTNYYGVERNEVETRIIPSTWREGGIGVYGDTPFGLAWDVGVTTGFDSAKFEEADAPLAGVHQELQLAKASDLSVYAAVNYHGVPGLLIGGGIFHGNSMHNNADFNEDNSRPDFSGIDAPITLWDVHARWQAGPLDIAALYAHGHFGDAQAIDNVIDAFNTANASDLPLAPEDFSGWLVQGAYTVFDNGHLSLTPFARYEEYNTQDSMPNGFVADPLNSDHVTTLGFSLKPDANVVFKADYQWFDTNDANERFNIGVGYAF